MAYTDHTDAERPSAHQISPGREARREIALKESTRYSAEAETLFSLLDAKVAAIFQEVRSWRGWQLVTDASADPALFRAVIREIFYAVHLYQADTTEAGFRMIGRMPKTEVKLLQVLSHHKAEEAEHGVWAFEDYLALGGDPERAGRRPQTPATFAVAGVWWWMAETADPLGYLGAEYLFENLTERVTREIVTMLAQRKLPADGLRFIVEHATEDEKHSNLFRHLVKDTLTRIPQSADGMLRCFDYFAQVYPLPVWDEAFIRATT